MTGMRMGWAAVLVFQAAAFALSGNALILAFMLVLILVPVGSIPVNLYVRKKLILSVSASGILRKSDRGSFQITVHNPTWLPVLHLRCRVRVENQLNGIVKEIPLLTSALPGKKHQLKLQAGDDYCGRLRISVDKVRLYDCFGMIGFTCESTSTGYMSVQPDTFYQSVRILPAQGVMEDSDLYSQDRPGQDLSEPYQIREYVPGDSMRQIHWKLSGKLDKLIVKDASLPITRSVLLFWERWGQSGDPDRTDAQAEVLVSLCRNLMEQSIRFTVGWNDTKTNKCVFKELRDMDELIGFIPRLLCTPGTREGTSGVSQLLGSGEPLPAHIVYIAQEPGSEVMELKRNSHVTMLLCGDTLPEGAIRFDPEHYEEQLSQIEI